DWSSDVCSADLSHRLSRATVPAVARAADRAAVAGQCGRAGSGGLVRRAIRAGRVPMGIGVAGARFAELVVCRLAAIAGIADDRATEPDDPGPTAREAHR